MGRLDGKVALITGAGRGVGRGIALALAREGADIALAEIDPETAARTTAEIEALGRRAVCVVCDIGSRAACEAVVERTVEELGGLDILINNAAVAAQIAPALEIEDEPFRRTMEVCVMASFWFMQASHPHLAARGGGSIVNFGSGAATQGMPTQLAYAAAKEAIRAMTRVAANEWGRQGIRVNSISPGSVRTPLLEFSARELATDGKSIDDMIAEFGASHPVGRVGTPAETSAMIAYLCSDAAGFVTGGDMLIDGGLTAQLGV